MNVIYPDVVEKQTYTIDDVLALQALPENQDKTIELIHGVLSIMTGGSILHTIIISRLVTLLLNFIEAHPLGIALTDGAIYTLPSGDLVIPDASFLQSGRYIEGRWPTRFDLMPDLAIEVVSPSNTPDKLAQKVQLYLDAGVRLVWVIYPTTQSITVYTPQADGTAIYQHLSLDGTLVGGDVLPGFSAEVRKIFPFIDA